MEVYQSVERSVSIRYVPVTGMVWKGGINMLADAWLKMVGVFTPDDMKLLKARGCASELFAFFEAFDKLVLAWQRTETPPLDKRAWNDAQTRLQELRAALREG